MTYPEYEKSRDDILELLSDAYFAIHKHGGRKKYWDDTRSTALVGIALKQKELDESNWLKVVKRYLKRNQLENDDDTCGSWNAEVWDTALSVLALKEMSQNSSTTSVKKAIGWISKIYLHDRKSWNDEPWETSWAVIAILTHGTIPPEINIYNPIDWLLNLRKPGQAKIVSNHYSAFFLIIYELLKKRGLLDNAPNKIEYDQARDMILVDFRDQLQGTNSLWADEAWSVGYILWAISETDKSFFSDNDIVRKVITWFNTQNGDNKGFWSDWEDTASAVIGLCKMLKALSEDNNNKDFKIDSHLREEVCNIKIVLNKKPIERDKVEGGYNVHFSSGLVKFFVSGMFFSVLGVALTLLTMSKCSG